MKSLLQVVNEKYCDLNNVNSKLYLMAIESEEDVSKLFSEHKMQLTSEITAAKTAKALTKKCSNIHFSAILKADSEDVLWENEDESQLSAASIIGILEINKLIRKFGQNLNLTGACLRGAQLQSADLRGANLENCDFQGANLFQANLKGANLIGANLQGCNLIEANLFGANLTNADLRRANLSQAELRKTTMVGTSLRGAELWSANIWGVDITQSFHEGVDLSRADTRGS